MKDYLSVIVLKEQKKSAKKEKTAPQYDPKLSSLCKSLKSLRTAAEMALLILVVY